MYLKFKQKEMQINHVHEEKWPLEHLSIKFGWQKFILEQCQQSKLSLIKEITFPTHHEVTCT